MKLFAALLFLLAPSMACAQSGVISGYGGTAQCWVLVDSVPSTPGCLNRASVACVVGNVGYVGGIGTSAPLTYPLAIPLYQRPNQTQVGVITIPQLPTVSGTTLQVGLNGTLSNWVLSAPYTGQSCSPPEQPVVNPTALARYCRQNPTVPACRG